MKDAFLTLGLTVALLGLACDSKEQCVADCDGQGSSGSTSAGESSGSSSDAGSESSSGAAALCAGHRAEAVAFIQENSACETVLDCVEVEAGCNGGGTFETCGTFGLAASADLEVWDAIAGDLADECACEPFDPCGAALMCNEQQQCEASFASDAYCPSIERDIDTFLAANRACENDDDCTQLGSSCYVNNGCYGVVVNIDTNPEDWQQLDQTLQRCSQGTSTDYCNVVGDCGFPSRCSDAGQCEIVF